MPTPPVGQPPTREASRLTRQERGRWVFGGLAVLVVLVVGFTALVVPDRRTEPTPPASTAIAPAVPSVDVATIASAEDKGPVRVITEEPTCIDWGPINGTLAAAQRNGWDRRNAEAPVAEWTPEQRSKYQAVAEAMLVAAEQTVELARFTPHRVMRELYEQTIAYWRAYAGAMSVYSPIDNYLALTATSTAGAITSICDTIDFGTASGRAPLVVPGAAPVQLPAITDPAQPQRFIAGSSPFCQEWTSMVSQFDEELGTWRARADLGVPEVGWSPEQRSLFAGVVPVMQRNADRAQLLGLVTGNVVVADFAALSAQYRRAFIAAVPTYAPPDLYLATVARHLLAATDNACRAASK